MKEIEPKLADYINQQINKLKEQVAEKEAEKALLISSKRNGVVGLDQRIKNFFTTNLDIKDFDNVISYYQQDISSLQFAIDQLNLNHLNPTIRVLEVDIIKNNNIAKFMYNSTNSFDLSNRYLEYSKPALRLLETLDPDLAQTYRGHFGKDFLPLPPYIKKPKNKIVDCS